jgi:hypothetical protein
MVVVRRVFAALLLLLAVLVPHSVSTAGNDTQVRIAEELQANTVRLSNVYDGRKDDAIVVLSGNGMNVVRLTGFAQVHANAHSVVILIDRLPLWSAESHAGGSMQGNMTIPSRGVQFAPGLPYLVSGYISADANTSVPYTQLIDPDPAPHPVGARLFMHWPEPVVADLNGDGRAERTHFLSTPADRSIVIAGLETDQVLEVRILTYMAVPDLFGCPTPHRILLKDLAARYCTVPASDALTQINVSDCPSR